MFYCYILFYYIIFYYYIIFLLYIFSRNTPQKVPLSQLMQQQKLKNECPIPNPQHPETSVLSTLASDRVSPANSPAHNILSLNDVFVPLESVQPGKLSYS